MKKEYKKFIVPSRFITRNEWGYGNGYVLLPPNHPYHRIHYNDIPVNVHGGLTFGELITETDLMFWQGNITREDMGYWMVGFDTAHYGDTLETCPKEYVQKCTDSLAEDLQKLDNIFHRIKRWWKAFKFHLSQYVQHFNQ